MERIFLAGSMARNVRRLARRHPGVRLVPTACRAVEPLRRKRVTESSLGLSGLKTVLGMSPLQSVELAVPTRGTRLRAQGITCHVLSRELPEGSFWRLEQAQCPLAVGLPSDVEVYVESPFLSFLIASAQLTRLAKKGAMSEQDADLRLFKLGVEECSSYAFDPADPAGRPCAFDLEPLMAAEELRSYLAGIRNMPGLVRARRVADLLFDGSASPMETLVNAGISLPPRLGCFGLEPPLANERISLDDAQRVILNHADHITPDLLWKELKIIIEFLGREPHEGEAAQDEDAGRIQDFETLGYCVLPVRYRHVKSPPAFNRLVARLAVIMEQCGVRGVCAWVAELAGDAEFAALQRRFFALMLPPVSDRW